MKYHIENDPQVNSVYVFELSRLSRKPDVFYSIRNYLIDHKIQLVVIKPSMIMSYYQMKEYIDDDRSIENISSITDHKKKRVLIRQCIKSFDIYQILPKKRYYMCEVTFVDGSMVSFVVNTYSKLVRYLDGRKMEYEFIRTILREEMKPEHYKRKTDGTSSRSYNTPHPDSFFLHERY